MTADLIIRAVKVSAATVSAGLTYLVAQIQFPDLETGASLGLIGFLAVMVGRYTFRQLEDYRSDLKIARERIDTLEDDLHALGRAKAQSDAHRRQLEDYAHRLRLFILAQGIPDPGIPDPPSLSS